MYGAIMGDIVGSVFEFDAPGWRKDFEFLTKESMWTDDSVMTIAVAQALMDSGKDASIQAIENSCVRQMQKWGRKYINAGYGVRFIKWLCMDDPKPYGSFGNGSAMRVSAAGWLYDSLERTREVARATAMVSHDHPEGLKGAECTAAVVFLARTGHSKQEIEEYVRKEFSYDLSESLEEMRARHRHDESCMDALPKALRSFLDGWSYEDVVRNAVSLGGDTDTIAAIAGSMGEAFFGMPLVMKARCRDKLEADMLEILDEFERFIGKAGEENTKDAYGDNAILEAAYLLFCGEEDMEKKPQAFITFLNVMAKRMSEGATVPMPFEDVEGSIFKRLDIENIKAGDTLTLEKGARLRLDTMKDGKGNLWIPLFFNENAMHKGQTANVTMSMPIQDVLRGGLTREDVQGVVIDPFGKPFVLTKEILENILNGFEEWTEG